MTKQPRPFEEMVEALERHVALLHEFAHKAFEAGDEKYGGEVAGKLRVLVARSRLNTPLLLELMAKTGIQPQEARACRHLPHEEAVMAVAPVRHRRRRTRDAVIKSATEFTARA